MTTNYCLINNNELEQQWTIKNFADELSLIETYINGDHTLESTFYHNARVQLMYSLRVCFNCHWVIWVLNVKPFSPFLNLIYNFTLLDKNGQPFQTVNGSIQGSQYSCNSQIMDLPSTWLLSKKSDLLPNNDLKMAWKLSTCDINTIIKPTLISKQHKSMKDNFEDLLKSETDSDVIFEIDGKELKAHKLILMARSQVFSTMFSIDMIEKKTNRVKIVDISSSIFELLLHFIYTDKIRTPFDLETGIHLLKAASKYQLESLEALCEAELYKLLTTSNVVDILLIAEKNHLNNLVRIIKNFINTNLQGTSFK